jgi:hypothetical protein
VGIRAASSALAAAAAAAAAATALVAVPLATGAPTSSAPPKIDGFPGYLSKLTCNPGTWSPDAQSFAYEWRYDGSDTAFATTRTYRPDASKVGYNIVCVVTATDAAGDPATAASPPARIARGRTTIKLKAKKVQHRKVTLTGTVGPRAAVKQASIVAYRVERDGLHQLFGKETLKANGKFKIVAPDEAGKNTYKVNFNPEPSIWELVSKTIKVTLKRR